MAKSFDIAQNQNAPRSESGGINRHCLETKFGE